MLEHLKPNGLDDLKIAGGDDGKGDNETKHVDVEDVGNVHGVVLPSPHPLDPTAAISWVIQSSAVFLPPLPDTQGVLAESSKTQYWREGD